MKKIIWLLRFVCALFVLNFVLRATAAKSDLRVCKTDSDCLMIDIGCGQPGAVNKNHKTYSDAPGGCGASMNYAEQAKRYRVACEKEECALILREPKNVYKISTDKKSILLLHDSKVAKEFEIIKKCGEAFVGSSEIRSLKEDAKTLQIIYGKHSSAEIVLVTGEIRCLGSD